MVSAHLLPRYRGVRSVALVWLRRMVIPLLDTLVVGILVEREVHAGCVDCEKSLQAVLLQGGEYFREFPEVDNVEERVGFSLSEVGGEVGFMDSSLHYIGVEPQSTSWLENRLC